MDIQTPTKHSEDNTIEELTVLANMLRDKRQGIQQYLSNGTSTTSAVCVRVAVDNTSFNRNVRKCRHVTTQLSLQRPRVLEEWYE